MSSAAAKTTSGATKDETKSNETKKEDVKINVEEKLTQAAAIIQTIAKPLVAAISVFVPYIIRMCRGAWAIYQTLPKNVVSFWVGFIFCFFGGLYPVTFAAVEAAEHGGRATVVEALKDLSDEAMVIIEESKKDDTKDEDGDGIADVKQINNTQYMMRKVNLVVTKMNPEKVDRAMASMYRVWLAVLAVLAVKFARTITLAVTISEFIRKPVNRFIAPTIALATPKGYKRWVPVILGWIIKAFAMSIAWYIQAVISAFTSALRGGLMMGRAIVKFCHHRGWLLWGLITEDHEDTYFDEVTSYILAALGFYVQFSLNFHVPFPFNLILWPLEFAEQYIRWTITQVKAA